MAVSHVIACFDEEKGLDPHFLLESIEEMTSNGVKLMLFHPTATNELLEKAQNRLWSTTSWSGGLLLTRHEYNNRKEQL